MSAIAADEGSCKRSEQSSFLDALGVENPAMIAWNALKIDLFDQGAFPRWAELTRWRGPLHFISHMRDHGQSSWPIAAAAG